MELKLKTQHHLGAGDLILTNDGHRLLLIEDFHSGLNYLLIDVDESATFDVATQLSYLVDYLNSFHKGIAKIIKSGNLVLTDSEGDQNEVDT